MARPIELVALLLRRLTLLALAVVGLMWWAAGAYYGSAPVLTAAELAAGPDPPHGSVCTTPVRTGSEVRILERLLSGVPARFPDQLAGIRAITGAVRSRRRDIDHYRFAPVEPLPERVMTLPEMIAKSAAWIDASDFAMSWLALHAFDRAGMRARVIRARSSPGPWSSGFYGIELWYGPQRTWILIDPCNGVLFNTGEWFLSLADVRRMQAAKYPFQVTPLDSVVTLSRLGDSPNEYTRRLSDVWVATAGEAPLSRRAEIRWRPLHDTESSHASVARTGACRRAIGTLVAYVTLTLLAALATRGKSYAGVRDRRCAGCRARRLVSEFAACVLADVGGVFAAIAAALPGFCGQAVALARTVGSMEELQAVAGLTHDGDEARRTTETTAGEVRIAPTTARNDRQPSAASSAGQLPGRSIKIAALGLVASLVFVSQVAWLRPDLYEDAFISFRYARSLAAGDGFTYNPGEPGVEGVSNLLWVLLLALGGLLGGSIHGLALALGMVLGIGTLFVTAAMAVEFGVAAYLPVLLVASNSCFVHNCVTGLETALACVLTLLMLRSWIRERDSDPAGMRATSLLTFAYSLARVEGAFVFLGITVFRLLEVPARRWPIVFRSWILPFVAAYSVLTITRIVAFGSPIPHIYEGRLIGQRGELFDRLEPGVLYVASFFAYNPAFLAVGVLLCRASFDLRAKRLVWLVAIHVALQIAVGGDVDYMGYSRFMMPAAVLLALLSQSAVAPMCGGPLGRWLAPAAAIAVALMSNAWSVPYYKAPLDARFYEAAPWVHLCRGNVRDAVANFCVGWGHLVSRMRGSLPYSFDAICSRHVAERASGRRLLSSSQAGRTAYAWPGAFWDHLGLATQRHGPLGERNSSLELTDYWLVTPEELVVIGDTLGLRRVYIDDRGGPIGGLSVYLLCSPPGPGMVPLRDVPRTPSGIFAWWRLPVKYFLVFGMESEEPLWDGARDPVDSPAVSALRSQDRWWLRRLKFQAPGKHRGPSR